MLDRHITRRIILGSGIGALLLSGGAPALAFDGPSFDCSHGVNSALAIILCRVPEAAQADWDLASAYWAFSSDDRDQRAFSQSMNQRCVLPRQETAEESVGRAFAQGWGRTMWGQPLPIPGPQPITQNHVRCVITTLHNRAATLRSKLTGDALVESKLSPEEHIEIQAALIQKGFLRNRFRDYGANADGQFGPNTRSGIKNFQRSIGGRETGFLSSDQRMALLESPQERQARLDREAAERQARLDREAAAAKARQDALDAEKQREEQARRDEEKRKQDAIDQENKRQEEEAKKAAEWREKIEEAKKKGPEYADKTRDLTWSLSERMNPMTEENEYTVFSTQPNGSGAIASIEGACLKGRVIFQATLQDANDPQRPLGFITSAGGAVVVNKRINDDPVFATTFPTVRWRNRIEVSTLSFSHDSAESADTTWRTLAEVETSQGTLHIKIPMFNAKVQTLIKSCQRQNELEKRRNGRRDAPA
jgi:peptidoglycan hydrolase-like protein with peptidoglycan-binding domain